MAYNTVLVALFEYVALTQSVVLDWQTVQRWPDGALERFMAAGLLVKAAQAGSIECPGCANACFMDIVTLSDDATKPSRAFVVCDDPDMQGEMGRVQIPLAHLQRWQTSLKQLAKVVATLLEFDYSLARISHSFSRGADSNHDARHKPDEVLHTGRVRRKVHFLH
jgi:hypothetical protein